MLARRDFVVKHYLKKRLAGISMENDTGLSPQLPLEEELDKSAERSGGASTLNPSATPVGAAGRMEVSAQTIARMMGIASATDLQLIEGRLDLLTSRVSTLMIKVDKLLVGLGAVASVGDIGRLETQIAAIKSLLRDATDVVGVLQTGQSAPAKEIGDSQGRRLREGIRSSSES
jgi:hypothetical protein